MIAVNMVALSPTTMNSHVNENFEMPTVIHIVGPSSTGKTTLCRALARNLDIRSEAHVEEVARTVMREQLFTRDDVGRLEMQVAIIEAQHKAETAARESGSHIVVCDRSSVDAVVYAMMTSRTGEELQERWEALVHMEEFRLALQLYRDRRSIFVLLCPITEWLVDDGTRSLENQERCWVIFKKTLEQLEIAYHELDEKIRDIDERVLAIRALAGL